MADISEVEYKIIWEEYLKSEYYFGGRTKVMHAYKFYEERTKRQETIGKIPRILPLLTYKTFNVHLSKICEMHNSNYSEQDIAEFSDMGDTIDSLSFEEYEKKYPQYKCGHEQLIYIIKDLRERNEQLFLNNMKLTSQITNKSKEINERNKQIKELKERLKAITDEVNQKEREEKARRSANEKERAIYMEEYIASSKDTKPADLTKDDLDYRDMIREWARNSMTVIKGDKEDGAE